MATIVVGSYAVQFPVGGYLSWVLQWLVGLRDRVVLEVGQRSRPHLEA